MQCWLPPSFPILRTRLIRAWEGFMLTRYLADVFLNRWQANQPPSVFENHIGHVDIISVGVVRRSSRINTPKPCKRWRGSSPATRPEQAGSIENRAGIQRLTHLMQCPENYRCGANRYGYRYIKEKIIVVHLCYSPVTRQSNPLEAWAPLALNPGIKFSLTFRANSLIHY